MNKEDLYIKTDGKIPSFEPHKLLMIVFVICSSLNLATTSDISVYVMSFFLRAGSVCLIACPFVQLLFGKHFL